MQPPRGGLFVCPEYPEGTSGRHGCPSSARASLSAWMMPPLPANPARSRSGWSGGTTATPPSACKKLPSHQAPAPGQRRTPSGSSCCARINALNTQPPGEFVLVLFRPPCAPMHAPVALPPEFSRPDGGGASLPGPGRRRACRPAPRRITPAAHARASSPAMVRSSLLLISQESKFASYESSMCDGEPHTWPNMVHHQAGCLGLQRTSL